MRYIVFVAAALLLTNCKTSSPASSPEPAGDWATQMRQMADSFSTLLPITLDPIQFNDPANQETIDQELSRLGHFAHEVGVSKQKPSDDPSFEFAGKQFSADMLEAKRQMKMGNRAYARFLIRGASNYCISCHTQTDRGPHFLANPENPYFNKLNALDKSNFLIATWSFDKGLLEYEKAMNSPDAALLPYATLESATLRALAVAVRVKKDPVLADSIVTRIMYSKWAPVYLQLSASKWKASIQEWKSSKKPARTLEDAKILISKGWTKQMESPLSRAGLIESLRASAVLHDLLSENKRNKAYAETLYYAGLNAEALKDLDSFLLNEVYFEACIRSHPHSEIAKNCYLRLEGAQIADYSAFDSMPMPPKVRESLTALRKLAQPNEGSWMEWGKNND
ncbi:MAG: hypothetical protein ACXVA9_06355 [Bdellovibrionales bacterium]